jgi:beta-lactamase superfamily II metal-dependent hydrolase
MPIQFIDHDFVAVRRTAEATAKRFATLAFGDAVEVLGVEQGFTKVRLASIFDGQAVGFIKGTPALRSTGILKLSMVDVQQGDGMILESPSGKIVFIDGGDNKLFARHAAARFLHRQTTAAAPLEVDAIIVTHGDADHFDGLNDIVRSETLAAEQARKRLFIHPKRIFHNGLCKGPTALAERDQLGRTVVVNGRSHVVALFDDTRQAPAAATNTYFARWHQSLSHWETRGPITCRRLAPGMDTGQLFDFLAADGVGVELHGPFTTPVVDPVSGHTVPSLPYQRTPTSSAITHLEQGSTGTSHSTAHTINGHSVAMRLVFGNVRINLTGDLNRDAMDAMLTHLTPAELECEILKAPHHGSADFDFEALQRMGPVVALVSSGDEAANKEHIHPRATLMAALGNTARAGTGIVFTTELAAFFAMRQDAYSVTGLKAFFNGRAQDTFTGADVAKLLGKAPDQGGPPGMFFGFERTNFGIAHIRTDGERVLVFTHSGKDHTNEAYRFTVSPTHEVTFARDVDTR